MLKKIILLLPFLVTGALLAQEEGAPPVQSMWHTMIMISIAVAFFYFLLWRPEQKRRKVLESQRGSMKQGDRAIAMGIVGTVVRVQDETVILKMYDGSKLEVLKGAITDVTAGSEEDAKKAAKEESKLLETNG